MYTEPIFAPRPDAHTMGRSAMPVPAATCPRCHLPLALVRPTNPRVRRVTARLCPSLACGYKLIVPL